MAGRLDITIEQGAAWIFQMTYQDADGNPVPLTGWQAQMEARASADATEVVFSLATPGNTLIPNPTGTITLGADGTILLDLAADKTSLIGGTRATKFVYDLELVPPNGDTIRLVMGTVAWSPEVTRP